MSVHLNCLHFAGSRCRVPTEIHIFSHIYAPLPSPLPSSHMHSTHAHNSANTAGGGLEHNVKDFAAQTLKKIGMSSAPSISFSLYSPSSPLPFLSLSSLFSLALTTSFVLRASVILAIAIGYTLGSPILRTLSPYADIQLYHHTNDNSNSNNNDNSNVSYSQHQQQREGQTSTVDMWTVIEESKNYYAKQIAFSSLDKTVMALDGTCVTDLFLVCFKTSSPFCVFGFSSPLSCSQSLSSTLLIAFFLHQTHIVVFSLVLRQLEKASTAFLSSLSSMHLTAISLQPQQK